MKYICSLVAVEDMARARGFYEGILGQKVRHDFGENVTYEGGFALHLKSHFSSLLGGRMISAGSNSFELYFEHDDLESAVEKLKTFGVEFIHDLMEQPWRQRVVRFYDPDRTVVEIGESMEHLCSRLQGEGLSVDVIAQRTGLAADFVEQAIR